MLGHFETVLPVESVAFGSLPISSHHFCHQLLECHIGLPSELGARLAGIPQQRIHLRRTEVPWINSHDDLARVAINSLLVETVAAPLHLHAQAAGRALDTFADRKLQSG